MQFQARFHLTLSVMELCTSARLVRMGVAVLLCLKRDASGHASRLGSRVWGLCYIIINIVGPPRLSETQVQRSHYASAQADYLRLNPNQ
jgi:hypothetical protein